MSFLDTVKLPNVPDQIADLDLTKPKSGFLDSITFGEPPPPPPPEPTFQQNDISTLETIKQLPSSMWDTLGRVDKKLETVGGILKHLPSAIGETLGISDFLEKDTSTAELGVAGLESLAKLGDALITAPFRLTKGLVGIVSPETADKLIPETVKHPAAVIFKAIGKDEWIPWLRDIEIGKSYQTQQQENIASGVNPWISGISVASQAIFDAAIVGGMAEGYFKGVAKKPPPDSVTAKQARQTLGVQKGATEAEIHKAYISKAKVIHPDKPLTGNEALFKELGKANETLTGVRPRITRFQEIAKELIKKRSVWGKAVEPIATPVPPTPAPVAQTQLLAPITQPAPIVPRPPVPALTKPFLQSVQLPAQPAQVAPQVTESSIAKFEGNKAEFVRSGGPISETDIQPLNASLRDIMATADKPEIIQHTQNQVKEAIDSGVVKQENGEITLYRVGKPIAEDRLVSATYSKDFIDRRYPPDELKGRTITTFKVKPEDIKVFIGEEEAEVLVSSKLAQLKVFIEPTTKKVKAPEITTNVFGKQIEEQFIRKATAVERKGGQARANDFNTIQDKAGFEIVYKPEGKNGAGYYYTKEVQPQKAITKLTAKAPTKPQKAPVAPRKVEVKVKPVPKVAKPVAKPIPQSKPSGIAKSVEAKAIEKGLIDKGYAELAGFDSSTIKKQAEMASKYGIEQIKRIATGQEALPQGMKPATPFSIAEDYAMKTGDGQLSLELAQSPIATQISEAASVLSLSRMRTPDSATAKIKEIEKTRKKVAEKKLKGKTEKQVKGEMKKSLDAKIAKTKVSRYDWNKLVNDLLC